MQEGPGEIRALREHDQVTVSKWERARSGSGRLQEAEHDHNRAIEAHGLAIALTSDPKFRAPALYERGLIERQLGRMAEGDRDVADATALDPDVGR